MTKERLSASVDPEVKSYLSQEGVNASELVNKLVKEQMGGSKSEIAMIELRLEQVRSKIEHHESETERLKSQEKQLLKRKNNLQEEQQQETENEKARIISKFDVVELSSRDEPMVDATDDELKPHAQELDMTVEELRTEIKEAE